MAGQDDAPIAAPPHEGDRRADVRAALPEPLERRPGQMAAAPGNDVVTAIVELEVGDARRVEASRELARQRLPRREYRAQTVHPHDGRAPASPGLGHDAVEPDAVGGGDANEGDGNTE